MAKSKAKTPAGNVPAGTAAAAQQDPTVQQDANITSESAFEFLANTPGDQTFADYQAAQGHSRHGIPSLDGVPQLHKTLELHVMHVQLRALNRPHSHLSHRLKHKMQESWT